MVGLSSRRALLAGAILMAGALSAPAAGEERDVALTSTMSDVSVRAEPVTVSLRPQPELSRAFKAAQAGDGAMAVAVHEITGRSSQPVLLNVYVNKQDADRTTSTEDPHFIGHLLLEPKQDLIATKGADFELQNDVPADPARPLQITLVPVIGINGVPRDLSLRVGQIYIRHDRGS
jgi:hypothetical protein